MPDDDGSNPLVTPPLEELLVAWLEARDAASVRAAWTAFTPVLHPVPRDRSLTAHSAALLAEAMLGERADWIVDLTGQAPTFEANRIVDASFLDHVWDIGGRCQETWALHERRDGARGVQVIRISAGTVPGEGRPEGAGLTVVRISDRDRAASLVLDQTYDAVVTTIGNVDLAPLEIYRHAQSFELRSGTSDIETSRGLIAQLASELDAHYDTSTQWPTAGGGGESAGSLVYTFAEGDRAVEISLPQSLDENTYEDERTGRPPPAPHRGYSDDHTRATVRGLPWGHKLELHLRTGEARGYVVIQLPAADIDRVLARLGAIVTLR